MVCLTLIVEKMNYLDFFSAWTNDRSDRVLIGYTTSNNLQIHMPIGDDPNSTFLQLVAHVRDRNGCVREWNMQPISVVPDMNSIITLITAVDLVLENSSLIISNPLIHILYNGNQNDVCPMSDFSCSNIEYDGWVNT